MASVSPQSNAPFSDQVQRFGELVWNRGKSDPSAPLPRRDRGFVCVVRQAQGLEALQTACQGIEDGLFCATLRYSIQSGTTFGSLIRAAIADLAAIHAAREEALLGAVLPPVADIRWAPLLDSRFGQLVAAWEAERGVFDREQIQTFIDVLSDEQVLAQGMRLILFAEVEGVEQSGQEAEQWQSAAELLFQRLPERVGLVLSGVPRDFELPDDPAHFLELKALPPSADSPPSPGQSTARFQPAELLADVPSSEDHLDREAYANSLATFLMHDETAPPITIGLYGRWGTGKSSFWQLLQRNLLLRIIVDTVTVDTAERKRLVAAARRFRQSRQPGITLPGGHVIPLAAAERVAERRIVTVAFNAWQYDDAKQTWAGLASTISERLEKALPPWRRQWMRLKYAWRSNRSDVLLNFGLPVLLLLLAGAVLLPWLTPAQVRELAPQGEANENPLGGLLKAVLPAGSLLLLLWGVGWRLVEVLKPVSERVAGYVKRTDYRADMGYQHKVIDDLKFLLAELEAARPGCRVLVYIDDLDRCSDEKIVEILRATILILADCRLFVMFGMDTEMIRRAIAAHYEKMKVPLADPQSFAESYLRKIVQIALYLPEAPPERRFSLVESMFSPAARQAYREREAARPAEAQTRSAAAGSAVLPYDLASIRRLVKVETVEDTADELAALAALKDYLPDNARELKRFVNTHRFLKILLSASGASWSGRKQQGLVKWLLFCTGWPARVDDVLRHARANPGAADCLAAACAANEWDEEVWAFAALGVSLPAAELLGDFDLAARLSQVVHDDPPPPSAGTEKVQLDIPVVAAE